MANWMEEAWHDDLCDKLNEVLGLNEGTRAIFGFLANVPEVKLVA